MSILYPNQRYRRITDISPQQLKNSGFEGIILDVDNTLTTHDNPKPGEGVMDWLAAASNAGLKLIILSNNTPERVKPFAEMLGLELGTVKSRLGYSWHDRFSVFVTGPCSADDSMELTGARTAASLDSEEQLVVCDSLRGRVDKVRPFLLASIPLKT